MTSSFSDGWTTVVRDNRKLKNEYRCLKCGTSFEKLGDLEEHSKSPLVHRQTTPEPSHNFVDRLEDRDSSRKTIACNNASANDTTSNNHFQTFEFLETATLEEAFLLEKTAIPPKMPEVNRAGSNQYNKLKKSLLDLPVELRCVIYDCFLPSNPRKIELTSTNWKAGQVGNLSPLLRTCKQINEDIGKWFKSRQINFIKSPYYGIINPNSTTFSIVVSKYLRGLPYYIDLQKTRNCSLLQPPECCPGCWIFKVPDCSMIRRLEITFEDFDDLSRPVQPANPPTWTEWAEVNRSMIVLVEQYIHNLERLDIFIKWRNNDNVQWKQIMNNAQIIYGKELVVIPTGYCATTNQTMGWRLPCFESPPRPLINIWDTQGLGKARLARSWPRLEEKVEEAESLGTM